MVSWLIVAVLVVILWLFFRARYMQHRLYALLIIAFLLFSYITASKIIEENKIDITTFDGLVIVSKFYLNWLGHAVKNTRNIVGNAFKMDWFSNSTLFPNSTLNSLLK